MRISCAWCKHVIGEKPGEGVTHTICAACLAEFNAAGNGCVKIELSEIEKSRPPVKLTGRILGTEESQP